MQNPPAWFLISGLALLVFAAFTGFAQARVLDDPPRAARWRVAHAGGAAGAVQLLALAGVWQQFKAPAALVLSVTAGLTLATWLFFVGPLAKALGGEQLGRRLNVLGAFIAVPSYVGLLGLPLG